MTTSNSHKIDVEGPANPSVPGGGIPRAGGGFGGSKSQDPDPTQSETTKPEVAQPEAPEPDVVEPDVVEPDVVEPDVVDPSEDFGDQVAAEAELAAAQQMAAEANDRYLRLQAEWDNYRKRTAAERASERERATEKLVKNLLPVLDDLERALEHAGTAADVASFAAGIDAVRNKLVDVFTRENVVIIDPVDEAFDANRHQAVGTQPDAERFDETVVQVYQKGYEMGGHVIRPAMVVVSTGGPKRPPEEPVDSDGSSE